ncbi:MAG: ribonucleotide reductase subunit alpha [Steroidobacteraceae bacterium]
MSIETFADLLAVARSQREPQRLLFVFAVAELPHDGSASEAAAFQRGEGGTLAPVVCVDKLATEVDSFEALRAESRESISRWDILFVAALGGRAGMAPNSDEAAAPLRKMVESIRVGHIGNFLAVNRDGELVRLERR